MEQLEYNLLFRWFVGLSIDEPVWVPTVFTKNRDRLLTTDMSQKLMAAILAHEKVAPLLSDDHFSVDGTLVEAWASFKSFKPKSPGGRAAACRSAAARCRDTGGTGTTETTGKSKAADGTSEMTTTDATSQARDRPQYRARLAWTKVVERHARLGNRSGCAPLSQGQGPARATLLHGACVDGEPQRIRGRCTSDARRRDGRAPRRHRNAQCATIPARHGGSRSAPTRATTRPSSSPTCDNVRHAAYRRQGEDFGGRCPRSDRPR